MTEDSIKNLHGKIAIFDPVKKLDTLNVVEKLTYSIPLAEYGQTVLTEVPVRDMPDIMTKRNCLDEVLIQAKAAPDSSCNLGNKLDMNDTMGDVIIFHKRKDLSLIDIPGVCPGMDDTISVSGVWGSDILSFSIVPPEGVSTG